jgi:hypothetical protein
MVSLIDDHEALRVATWNFDRLRALGFDVDVAAALAAEGVTWHAARDLLERGCDHATVYSLLRS